MQASFDFAIAGQKLRNCVGSLVVCGHGIGTWSPLGWITGRFSGSVELPASIRVPDHEAPSAQGRAERAGAATDP